MFQASPAKRRKLTGKLVRHSTQVLWPAGMLPVELFALIIAYLPRSSVQNMRLVNAEFEKKVAQVLFRAVVVPFNPELYGICSDTAFTNNAQGSIVLQDEGMRVFQGFGQWIKKFALSFEIDYNKLISPPSKSDQQAITSFWGIYRWPFEGYNRYIQLEGLEQTADETKSMAMALKFLSRAEELALSIEGGLGWLAGPDTNPRVTSREQKPPVFSSSGFVPESQETSNYPEKLGLGNRNQYEGTFSNSRQILEEAGYEGLDLDHAISMLLENEGLVHSLSTNDETLTDFTRPDPSIDQRRRGRIFRRNQSTTGVDEYFVSHPVEFDDMPQNADETSEQYDEEGDNHDVSNNDEVFHQPAQSSTRVATRTAKLKDEAYPLKPNDLSSAQREMLLEMEWAQSAFMQSWAIAVIDNTATFDSVRTLTISRLPHRHLSILCRQDFWKSLPSLNRLSLAIIPDWRQVKKESTGWVQDNRVTPSESIPGVFKLLDEHISKVKNITSLHFEWLCGGESASGIYARNQLILAAPAVSEVMHMINRASVHPVLSLPFVEHLSLKNCWFSPHIMKRFLYPMRAGTLKSISLESVSLTATIPINAQPSPVAAVAVQNPQMAHLFAVHVAAIQAAQLQYNNNTPLIVGWQAQQNPNTLHHHHPPNAHIPLGNILNPPMIQVQSSATQTDEDELPIWLRTPRSGSWPDVIDYISPASTLADIRFERNIGPEPEPRALYFLKRLAFESCGYVKLPLGFDQSLIDQPSVSIQTAINTPRRRGDIDSYMMKPQESMLGTIVNGLSYIEKLTLETAWNLSIGWDRTKSDTTLDAQLDGIANPGHGRFRGTISSINCPLTSTRGQASPV